MNTVRACAWLCAGLLAWPVAAQVPASPGGRAREGAREPVQQAPVDNLTAAMRLVDQLAAEGIETAVLVGLAVPVERARAGSIARQALDKLALAEPELSARAVALGSIDPEKARRLREFDLGLRVPLYRARAALILGVAEGDLARLSGVVDLLETVDPIAVGPAALRRVNLALALYHRALIMGAQPGQAHADIDRAIGLIAKMSEWDLGDDASRQVPPLVSAEAWFAALRMLTHRQASMAWAQGKAMEAQTRPPFVGGARAAEPGLVLRHAQVRSAALASIWASGVSGAGGGFGAVVGPIEATVVPGTLRLTVEQCQAIREELTGRAALALLDGGASEAEVPTLALVAVGGVLARDPAQRERAGRLIAGARARADIGALAPEADMHAALALSHADDGEARVRAVELLNQAVEGGLREPRKSAILAALPGIAKEASALAAKGGDEALRARATASQARALRLAGRGATGGLAMAEAELRAAQSGPEGGPDAGTLSRALEALGAVPADAPEHARAVELGSAAIDAAIERARRQLLRLPTPEATGNLARVAQMGADWHASRGARAQSARARVALAEALVAAGDPGAVALYRELLATEPPPESPMLMTIGLARAQRASGDVVGAFQTYRSMVDLLEEEPAKRPEYFVAWADMLQVLAADNASGHRTAQIRARLAHLRSLDPSLGTPEAAETVEMVERLLR
jgi:hypothetical protein